MYKFSPKLKMASIVAMVVGLIMFAIGFGINASRGEDYVLKQASHTEMTHQENQVQHESIVHNTHHDAEHTEHLLHQYHNRPWTAFFMAAFLFTGVAAVSMFFLAIQHVSQSGWSVVVTRIMEGMTAFLPIGSVFILIVLIASALHFNHMYHWMDTELIDFNSDKFDHFMRTKSGWLNVPFWLTRSVIYLAGWTFFAWMLRKKSKRLDETGQVKDYWTLYKWGVFTIIFFALTSMSSGWDWIMSIDPHWYSTLFGWYVMTSYLVTAVAIMIILAVYLKKKGYLPKFNDNHLHDLTKYLFGFSLLWGYLWLCQFELIWYANIPEESVYFQQREAQYNWTYYTMLIPNVVLPFVALISSSIKRNYNFVFAIAVIVIIGHWIDIFNQMMPGTVGAQWSFGLVEFGALLLVGGAFMFVVLRQLSKMNLEPKGNPLFHESEVYEYPF